MMDVRIEIDVIMLMSGKVFAISLYKNVNYGYFICLEKMHKIITNSYFRHLTRLDPIMYCVLALNNKTGQVLDTHMGYGKFNLFFCFISIEYISLTMFLQVKTVWLIFCII